MATPNPRDTHVEQNHAAFVEWLAGAARGQLAVSISEAFTECIDAVRVYGTKSTLALTVTLQPSETGYGDLEVVPKLKYTPARPPAPVLHYYPTEDGGLSENAPAELPFGD